jgi:PilZ domain-containing protein
MTADMAFECLLVSHDPGVFGIIDRVLREFAICTHLCLSASKAVVQLQKGSTDLVVIDWDGADCSELLKKARNLSNCKKPTVVAITPSDYVVPGVHLVLKKPLTVEAGINSLKSAYRKMLVDHRRHARYALMIPVIATHSEGGTMPVTITDIGDGGVGLSTKEYLSVGDVISFRVHLPGSIRHILIEIRVLWAREYGRVGCEFLRIPPVDLVILQDWLKERIRVKKPLLQM